MTTITLPRAVVEQALEALERNTSQDMSVVQGNALARHALRAALAQQAEPVEPETPCRRAICQRGPDGYCAPCHERMYP